MTPEQAIERAVRAAGLPCGHWPYTCAASVFIGWRPAQDVMSSASNRPTRVRVRFDLVICHRRGADFEAETARFTLYRALENAGFTVEATGPETYTDATEMFYWPVTASRGFGLDAAMQPYDLLYNKEDDHEEASE